MATRKRIVIKGGMRGRDSVAAPVDYATMRADLATAQSDILSLESRPGPGVVGKTDNVSKSTTVINTTVAALDVSFTLPAGNWRVVVDGSGIMNRSVATGALICAAEVEAPAGSTAEVIGQNWQHLWELDVSVGRTMRAVGTYDVVSAGGTFIARFRYGGETTAGTTTTRANAITATWTPVEDGA